MVLGGEKASRLAVSTVAKYVSESVYSYYAENVPAIARSPTLFMPRL